MAKSYAMNKSQIGFKCIFLMSLTPLLTRLVTVSEAIELRTTLCTSRGARSKRTIALATGGSSCTVEHQNTSDIFYEYFHQQLTDSRISSG